MRKQLINKAYLNFLQIGTAQLDETIAFVNSTNILKLRICHNFLNYLVQILICFYTGVVGNPLYWLSIA